MSRRLGALAGVIASLMLIAGIVIITVSSRSSSSEVTLTASQALLSGRVVNDETGAGVPDAVLKVAQGPARLVVRADGKGEYSTVIDVSEPIALTVDAPGHKGAVAFGKLCPKERRRVVFRLPPRGATTAPPAPIVLPSSCTG